MINTGHTVDICLRRDFNKRAALSSHPGTTFAALAAILELLHSLGDLQ
jgi:hypothetical protein